MNIVIPMAGQGSRFANSGFALPKPLINVAGKPMYRYAVDSLPIHLASKLIFVLIRSEHLDLIVDDIELNYGHYPLSIIILESNTSGQAESVLKCEKEFDLTVSTLVHNCDTYFHADQVWNDLIQSQNDGALMLFKSNESRWSYALLNEECSKIIDVREKKVISEHASTGTYYFKNTYELLANIKFIISKDIRENNEFYLSSIYRIMLQNQKTILPLWTKRFLCFGTPQDLVNSLNEIVTTQNNLSYRTNV
jgi:dTDP-glucose pyrophosphorylase